VNNRNALAFFMCGRHSRFADDGDGEDDSLTCIEKRMMREKKQRKNRMSSLHPIECAIVWI